MKFYTNFCQIGPNLAVRYVENGIRKQDKFKINPRLFVKIDSNSDWKSLNEESVKQIYFDSTYDAREFTQKYKNAEGIEILGNTNFKYPEIHKLFGGEYDCDLIRCFDIDIEVDAIKMPKVETAGDPISAITIIINKKDIHVFGYSDIDQNKIESELDRKFEYHKFPDEISMLRGFIAFWTIDHPDVITGWNCIPSNSFIYGKNQITLINKIKVGDFLCDSVCEQVFPTSTKVIHTIKLSNGYSFNSSDDHIFPILRINDEKYTQLKYTTKNNQILENIDSKVSNILQVGKSSFLEIPLHKNTNDDFPIDDDIVYLLGFIYTDGSISNKLDRNCGFKIYQSDYNLLQTFDNILTTSISGKLPKGYSRRVKHSLIKDFVDMIYTKDNNKKLNVEELSKLSYRQWNLFLSGMLDGDGFISGNSICLCNFNDDINSIYQLALWNGMFSTITKTSIRLIDFNWNDLCLRKTSRWKNFTPNLLKRTNQQKAKSTNYKRVGDSYFIKIKSITSNNTTTDMLDIKTNTGYFNYGGIKTHNCTGFDLPYLINRITNVLSETTAKKLSPWGRFRQEWVTSKYGKEQLTYVIDGIESLDYLELYRKHTFITRENYKLNTIAKIELKEQKLEYEGSLHELFVNDPTRYFAYNIKDVILVDKLDDKLGLLNIVYSIAYFANENYSDTFSPVKTWDNIICNYLWDRKICVPLSKIKDRESYEGAFVKQPLHSKISWGASVDISSAYPNTIRTWNIGPETRLKESELDDSLLEIKNYISSRSIDDLRKCTLSKEYQRILKDRSVCVSLTGEFYSVKKKGILASLVADLYDERTRNKNLAKELKKVDPVSNKKQIDILNTKQKVQKILLNSLYGATANPAFRFFQIENARSITLTVQYLVQHMGDSINAYLNDLLNTDTDYVQYIDTDSNYFSLDALLDKYCTDSSDDRITTFIDKFCVKKIEPLIKKTFTETTGSFGCPENTITASRETIFKSGVWKTKKLYAVAATDVEGERYSVPEIKVTGLEIVKSSTPEICRKALEECVRICLLEDESALKSFVKSFKDKYNKFSISEIAFPRGITDLQTYAPIDGKLLWAKKTPSHVKAAHVFNYLLKLHQIDNIPTINDGAKIKFVCLKTPNKLNSNVFGWEDKLPKQFDIEKWVDYDTQYEKSFLKPLTDILAVLGWDSEDRSTLDAFFG